MAQSTPTPVEVRAAAETLKRAIDRHLETVERRTGESDPAVWIAYDELRRAAVAYDERLYNAYDEVTPFAVGETRASVRVDDEPLGISVLLRRDYAVNDPDALIEAGRQAAPDAVRGLSSALAVLFDFYEPDDLDQYCEDVGLEAAGSTLWVLAHEPEETDGWLEAPFEGLDEGQLIFRLDETVEE
ncbi:MAG: hypothetical protein ACRDPK_08710 [Carbonactinosporaceae bacterium]